MAHIGFKSKDLSTWFQWPLQLTKIAPEDSLVQLKDYNVFHAGYIMIFIFNSASNSAKIFD